MNWLIVKYIGVALRIIGAILLLVIGIVSLTKKYTDEETERKSQKAGFSSIIIGILLLIWAIFF